MLIVPKTEFSYLKLCMKSSVSTLIVTKVKRTQCWKASHLGSAIKQSHDPKEITPYMDFSVLITQVGIPFTHLQETLSPGTHAGWQ